jgi:hypothetical protein
MKKLLLLSFAVACATFTFAQESKISKELANRAVLKSKHVVEPSALTPASEKVEKRKPISNSLKANYLEWVVGSTFYDNQSNSAVMNRIENSGGEVSTIYTFSLQQSAFSDRGTGYNFTDGSIWGDLSSERLEDIRTGWPTILHTGGGREVVIAHDFPTQLYMMSRDALGSGTWTEGPLEHDVAPGISWNRAALGGSDNNTIHLVAISVPIANQAGTLLTHAGMDGAILYSRSTDQGETWDIQNIILPGMDSTEFLGFSADSYAIHARGNKVALAVFNTFADSFVMISEDNGDTWTKKILVDFPVDLYTGNDAIIDLNEDNIADTLYSTDNSGCIHIDAQMQTHVAWGNMFYQDDVLGDDQWSFFPYTDGLAYWNEGMEENSWGELAFVADLNEDGEVTLEDDYSLYYVSMTGFPQMAEAANGDLFLSYSGVVESHSSGSQNFRHVHLMKSADNGDSWSEPVDATPDLEFWGFECIFPSMAKEVDDHVHILYQRDFEPGMSTRGDLDPPTLNDLVYYRITTDLVVVEEVSVSEQEAIEVLVYPNPASQNCTVQLSSRVDAIQVLDRSGRLILEQTTNSLTESIDLEDIAPGMYQLVFVLDGERKGAVGLVKQ